MSHRRFPKYRNHLENNEQYTFSKIVGRYDTPCDNNDMHNVPLLTTNAKIKKKIIKTKNNCSKCRDKYKNYFDACVIC